MENSSSSQANLKRLAVIGSLAVSIVPIVLIAIYMSGYLIDLPWWDEYDVSVIIAGKTAANTLTLPDLFLQQNEHIIVFTNLVTVFSTLFFHWYVPLGSWVSFGLALINLVILLDLFRRDCPEAFPVAAPVFSVLVFTVRQALNWQSAFQSQWFFVVLWFLLALWVLRTRPQGWWPVIWAAILSVLATLSFTLGLLLWGLLPGVLFLMGYRRRRYYAFWAVAVAAIVGIYLAIHVANPPREITLDPLYLTTYSLAMIGNPFSWTDNTVSIVFAVLALVVLVANLAYLWRRLPASQLSVWLALVVFTVGSAYVTGVGRAFLMRGEFVIQSLLGRYTTISVLLWIAVVAMTLMSLISLRQEQNAGLWKKVLGRSNVAFVAVLLGAQLLVTALFYQFPLLAPPLVTPRQMDCVRSYPQTHDDKCLDGLHWRLSTTQEGIMIMEKYHLSLFSQRP